MNQVFTRLTSQWPVLQFFTNNLVWILISLILSLIIWVVATLETNPIQQRQFNESLTIKFIDTSNDNVVLLNTTTLIRNARITLRAPRSSWEAEDEKDRFTRDDLEISVDLSNLGVGVHTVELQARILDKSPSGRVVSISPQEITVEMVPLETIQVPLGVNIFSELPPDYEYTRSDCNIEEITVSGPASLIEEISRAVVYLNVRQPNEDSSHSGQVILIRTNNREFTQRDLEGLRIEPSQAICNITINRIENSKTLQVDPVIIGSPPEGYLIGEQTWTPETIVVVGDSESLEGLGDFIQTEAIDLTNQTSSFSRTVQAILPEGVQLRSETLITVSIEIQPIPTTRQFAEVPIKIINLDPALTATLVPQTVIVTVEGPEPVVRELMPDDLLVTVNLQGYGPGTHNDIQANVSILRESARTVTQIKVRPNLVDVVISAPATPTPSPTPTAPPNVFGKALITHNAISPNLRVFYPKMK